MAIEYGERVLAHFYEPRNVGLITDADGIGWIGDASCGDLFYMFVKVSDGRLADVKYLVRGCGAAIATTRRSSSTRCILATAPSSSTQWTGPQRRKT